MGDKVKMQAWGTVNLIGIVTEGIGLINVSFNIFGNAQLP